MKQIINALKRFREKYSYMTYEEYINLYNDEGEMNGKKKK